MIEAIKPTFQRAPTKPSARPHTVVVMPAYNAALTLKRTLDDIPPGSCDEIILVDDCSNDGTAELAESSGLTVIRHHYRRGYGGNQKTCYDVALASGAEIIVMLHPDYQYDSKIIPLACSFIINDVCDVILGNRIRTRRETLAGGMPLYKYLSNRVLTITENIVFGQNLGDFHSGFRAYAAEILHKIPYHKNSDGFVFDTEFLAQASYFGFRIGDIPVPVRYFDEASSISFTDSLVYGLKTMGVMLRFMLQRRGLRSDLLFEPTKHFNSPML